MMADRRPILQRIFLSPSERRLRAGWRLALHTLLLLFLVTLVSIPFAAAALLLGLARPGLDLLNSPEFQAASTAISLPAILVATWVARRFLDHRPFRSLGFDLNRRAALDLLIGFLIAGAQMSVIFALERAAGWLRFEGWAWQSRPVAGMLLSLAGWLLVYVAVAIQEETLFRGYYLQNLRDGLGMGWALLISSAIFGVAHLSNPEASPAAVLGILGAGLFLALGWLRTRQLWLPIGLHLGWNFFQGPVFGFPVSGTGSFRLIQQTVQGPIVLTGGPFGPEAGLVVFLGLFVGVILVLTYTRGRLAS
jgi:membrane protease YdiL (CAAX protease family)